MSKKAAPEKPTLDFEESLATLESLVKALEVGQLSLNESLEKFEQGVALTRLCQQALDEAEQKLQVLTEADATDQGIVHSE